MLPLPTRETQRSGSWQICLFQPWPALQGIPAMSRRVSLKCPGSLRNRFVTRGSCAACQGCCGGVTAAGNGGEGMMQVSTRCRSPSGDSCGRRNVTQGPSAQPTLSACRDVPRAHRADGCVRGAILSPASCCMGRLRSPAALPRCKDPAFLHALSKRPGARGPATSQGPRIRLSAWQAELFTPPVGGSKCLPTQLCSHLPFLH